MYVIAIAWLYVTILMALTERNVTAGILTFLLYGLMPLALFLWLMGTPVRRRRIRAAESATAPPADSSSATPSETHPESDR